MINIANKLDLSFLTKKNAVLALDILGRGERQYVVMNEKNEDYLLASYGVITDIKTEVQALCRKASHVVVALPRDQVFVRIFSLSKELPAEQVESEVQSQLAATTLPLKPEELESRYGVYEREKGGSLVVWTGIAKEKLITYHDQLKGWGLKDAYLGVSSQALLWAFARYCDTDQQGVFYGLINIEEQGVDIAVICNDQWIAGQNFKIGLDEFVLIVSEYLAIDEPTAKRVVFSEDMYKSSVDIPQSEERLAEALKVWQERVLGKMETWYRLFKVQHDGSINKFIIAGKHVDLEEFMRAVRYRFNADVDLFSSELCPLPDPSLKLRMKNVPLNRLAVPLGLALYRQDHCFAQMNFSVIAAGQELAKHDSLGGLSKISARMLSNCLFGVMALLVAVLLMTVMQYSRSKVKLTMVHQQLEEKLKSQKQQGPGSIEEETYLKYVQAQHNSFFYLQDLATNMTDQIVLSQARYSKEGEVVIAGMAKEHQDVSDYMALLGVRYKDVKLKNITALPSGQACKFELVCAL